MAGVGQHQGHFARAGIGGVGCQVLALQQHSAALRRQLPGQRFEQGGFARAVWPDEGENLSGTHGKRDVPNQCLVVIAYGELVGV